MTRARSASILKVVTFLFSGTVVILAVLASGTDASGSPSTLTVVRLLALYAAIPVTGALALCHVLFVLLSDKTSSTTGKVLWAIAFFAAYPVSGVAYWLTTGRRGDKTLEVA